ncbi:dual specificity protein phosphatase 3-like [Haliotis cracherodii]|uniref:dual specificity protein phosphatase 3-like n=1 Tax=Haliotis cracherodii TaxID=6455 RepID=UPI0039EB9D4A
MTSHDSNLLREVREYLQSNNDSMTSKPVPHGAYSLFSFPAAPKHKYDEVYPGIVLGDHSTARDKEDLKAMGITHVVNTCMGAKFNMIDTNAEYFSDVGIQFFGFPGKDIFTYNLSQHFDKAADFIDKALADNGKVYIHCMQGVSRSGSTVLAFLMLKRDMPLKEAVKLVRAKREIFPNDGFLKQLCELNRKLHGNPS